MAAKRRYALDKMKILSEEFIALPKLLKVSLIIAVIGIGLSCTSLWLQFRNASMLRKAETKHRSFINRITNAGILGDITHLGQARRSYEDLTRAEKSQSDLSQCRYRQKTEWMYYDIESDAAQNGITVDFSASEGFMISTASCVSNNANTKYLQQSGDAYNRIYQCVCNGQKGDEKNEDILGYEKLICTANYWECPTK